MIGMQLEPVDTWFFRDGTPFVAGGVPQYGVTSLFPPHPPTVAGALRAALAITRGWNGRARWPRYICDILGDGPENLGVLALDGPFLLTDEQPLFRAPRHLLGKGDSNGWTPCTFLRPGQAVACDLGDAVQLPEAQDPESHLANLRAGDKEWLTHQGLNDVLRGKIPASTEIVSDKNLWSMETRIGLERDRSTRAAKEGMLYTAQQVRLQASVSLGMCVSGLPQDWNLPFDKLMPLGGEGRLAECRAWNAESLFDSWPVHPSSGHVALIALSPLDLDGIDVCNQQPLAHAGGLRLVSACLDRPQRVGGWDSLRRRPLPLRSVWGPGSVLFCEIQEPARFQEAVVSAGGGLIRVGARQQLGFGLVALGVWPNQQETNP